MYINERNSCNRSERVAAVEGWERKPEVGNVSQSHYDGLRLKGKPDVGEEPI